MASPPRMKNTSVSLPIAYGSIAWLLGQKKADDSCTHQWTLYVRSPYGLDLSPVIEKVRFSLHPSFVNSIRDCVEPPYEVTEKGWGEFEAVIDIFFRDPTEKPVELRHLIRLFHLPPQGQSTTAKKGIPKAEEPVVHEYYDEVVFTDPTVEFYQQFQKVVENNVKVPRHFLQDHFPCYSDFEDLHLMQSVHEFVRGELRAVKDKLLHLEAEARDVKQKQKGGGAQGAQPPSN